MAKVKTHEIDSKERYRIISELLEVIAGLKNKDEVINFFLRLFTPSEAVMMARRIQIARLLANEKDYEYIRNKLKVSNQTITKTYQWLNRGDEKYIAWLKNYIQKEPSSTKEKKDYSGSLLDRYPQHRFLKDLFNF